MKQTLYINTIKDEMFIFEISEELNRINFDEVSFAKDGFVLFDYDEGTAAFNKAHIVGIYVEEETA